MKHFLWGSRGAQEAAESAPKALKAAESALCGAVLVIASLWHRARERASQRAPQTSAARPGAGPALRRP
eukprot:15451575-Alexandrium_andersonii.AAC.1